LANEELVYVLTTAGAKAVLEAAEYSRIRHLIYRRNDRGKRSNVRHHLALSELQLVLELGSTEWQVEQFVTDERRSRFSVNLPAVDVPGAGPLGQVKTIGDEQRGLQPDARALIRFPSGQRTLLLFDVDVQRRANARTDTRTLAYHVLVSRHLDEIMRAYAVNNAVVVFVAPGERALEQLRIRAQHVVRAGRAAARLIAQPLFLFWNRGGWFARETLRRRQYVGTSRERERTWTVFTLRDPRDILSASGLETLTGKRRRLIQQSTESLPSNRYELR
jgi:hypothetical protein